MTIAAEVQLQVQLAGIRAQVGELSKQAEIVLSTLNYVKQSLSGAQSVADLLHHEHANLRQAIVNILDELDRIAPVEGGAGAPTTQIKARESSG